MDLGPRGSKRGSHSNDTHSERGRKKQLSNRRQTDEQTNVGKQGGREGGREADRQTGRQADWSLDKREAGREDVQLKRRSGLAWKPTRRYRLKQHISRRVVKQTADRQMGRWEGNDKQREGRSEESGVNRQTEKFIKERDSSLTCPFGQQPFHTVRVVFGQPLL